MWGSGVGGEEQIEVGVVRRGAKSAHFIPTCLPIHTLPLHQVCGCLPSSCPVSSDVPSHLALWPGEISLSLWPESTFSPQELNRVPQKAKEQKNVGLEFLICCGLVRGMGCTGAVKVHPPPHNPQLHKWSKYQFFEDIQTSPSPKKLSRLQQQQQWQGWDRSVC